MLGRLGDTAFFAIDDLLRRLAPDSVTARHRGGTAYPAPRSRQSPALAGNVPPRSISR
jgi:hypothetical protein